MIVKSFSNKELDAPPPLSELLSYITQYDGLTESLETKEQARKVYGKHTEKELSNGQETMMSKNNLPC